MRENRESAESKNLKEVKKSLAPWITAQGVILALIIKEALENIYTNLASGLHSISAFNYDQFLTFIAFTVLLGRFYGGSYRFIQKGEAFSNVFIELKNLIGSTALFVAFFFMSKSILDIHQFIFWCLWLHIFDIIWFFVALTVNIMAIIKLKDAIVLQRSANELRATSAFFLLLSAVTVGVLYYRWGDHERSLHFLVSISLLDLFIFYRFYFHGDYNFIWAYLRKRRKGLEVVGSITIEPLPIGSRNASDDPLTS